MVSASINPLPQTPARPSRGERQGDAASHGAGQPADNAFSATLDRRLARQDKEVRTDRGSKASDTQPPSPTAKEESRPSEPADASSHATQAGSERGRPVEEPEAAGTANGPEQPLAAASAEALRTGVEISVTAEAAQTSAAMPSPPLSPELPAAEAGSNALPDGISAEAAASLAALIASLAARPADSAAMLPPGFTISAASKGLPAPASETAKAAVAASPLAAFQDIGANGADDAEAAGSEASTATTARSRAEAPSEAPAQAARDNAPNGRALGVDALSDLRKFANPANAAANTPLAQAPGETAAPGAPSAAVPPMPDAASALAGAASSATSPLRADAPVTQLAVHTPAGQRAWAEDVGNRVIWMLGRNDSKAELVLTPAHLGKLEVSIQMNGDQTTAHFVAATSGARDALEQALPRLREVLQQAGINLGEANVSTSAEHHAQQRGQGFGRTRQGEEALDGLAGDGFVPAPVSTWIQSGRGVVDIFA